MDSEDSNSSKPSRFGRSSYYDQMSARDGDLYNKI